MNFANEREALCFLLGVLLVGVRPAIAAEWLEWYGRIPAAARFTTRFPQPDDKDPAGQFERRTRYTNCEALLVRNMHEVIKYPEIRHEPGPRGPVAMRVTHTDKTSTVLAVFVAFEEMIEQSKRIIAEMLEISR